VGPYGAFLADGSEYSGQYGIGEAELRNFHRGRWEIIATSGADLLACETLPNLEETRALLELLHRTPGRWAWFSFSCRDGSSLWDGTPFARAVALCAASAQVAAVGVNCTAPDFIESLLKIGRKATDKPLIVYPNSGEKYDPVSKSWVSSPTIQTLPERAATWVNQGARAVGGCCRTGPAVIAEMRRHLLD
jgi:homocysteine S-methyltransferase